jgi:hypothetical protein
MVRSYKGNTGGEYFVGADLVRDGFGLAVFAHALRFCRRRYVVQERSVSAMLRVLSAGDLDRGTVDAFLLQ